MTEFLNYKVDLFLKDGTKSSGTITRINPQVVTIDGKSVNAADVADLKVLQLPKKTKGKGGQSNQNAQNTPSSKPDSLSQTPNPSYANPYYQQYPVDDAILYSRTSTPPLLTPSVNGVPKDFDFAANLAMFDKKSVFESFQQNDTVNPSDRLVSHNRKKEKYDNDEMVVAPNADNWDKIGSNTLAHRKEVDKAATPPIKDKLKIIDALGQTVTVALQVQLLEIERFAGDFGMSAAMTTEACAVNLSQLICANVLGGSARLSNKKNHNLPPLVLLLVGGSRCGARAFAAGRHLTNHGIRVMGFMVSTPDEGTDAELVTQMTLFEKCGGKMITGDFSHLLHVVNHELSTPVELIVDALQGYDEHLDDLFYTEEDVAVLTKVVSWCNTQLRKVMSLDIPSGIDGGSGTICSVPGLLKIECRWCVLMGLPINGILHAYKNGLMELGETVHWMVDVGIPNKVYGMKGGLRKFDGFWCAAEGVKKIEVVE